MEGVVRSLARIVSHMTFEEPTAAAQEPSGAALVLACVPLVLTCHSFFFFFFFFPAFSILFSLSVTFVDICGANGVVVINPNPTDRKGGGEGGRGGWS